MDAMVSGVAARVAFVDGSNVSFVDAARPAERHPISRGSLPRLFGDAYDVEYLKGTTEQQAFERLLVKWNIDRSFRMLQIALDQGEDRDARVRAATFLTELSRDPSVKESIENTVFAIGLPDNGQLEEIEAFFSSEGCIPDVVQNLIMLHEQIISVRKAWEEIPDDVFQGNANRCRAERAAILLGSFRDLVIAIKEPEKASIAIANCYFNLKNQANSREIIRRWTERFVDRKTLKKAKKTHDKREEALDDRVKDDVYSYRPVHSVILSVDTQKSAIVQQLERGNHVRARAFAEQLVKWQLGNGKPVFAAKSLCSLAQEARRLGNPILQLEWVERAIQIAPEDAWAHGQAGDVYFSQYRFNDADREYKAAISWGSVRRGKNGIAKVLAATGYLEEALNLSEKIVQEHADDPEIPGSWALQSEILRKMGRLEDALSSYEEAITRFPDQSVLRCGRAAVLTDMSRYAEALEAYDEVMKSFENQVVASSGRADVLKNLGRLDEALAAYDQAILEFDEEPVPVCGRADVLRTMGKLNEARDAYIEAKRRFPYEPTAYCGLGDVYREKGDLELALITYEDAGKRFQYDARIRIGFANTLRSAGRFEDALQEFDRIVYVFKYDLAALSGRANILKSLGSYDEALKAYDRVLAIRPDYAYARFARAAIFAIRGDFNQALALLPTRAPSTLSEWVAFHIRGMMHLKRSEFDAALKIFSKGASESPFYRNRQYFMNAMAATKVRMQSFDEAISLIGQSDNVISRLLLSHSYAAIGRVELALIQLESVNDNELPPLVELRDEIAAQFRLSPMSAHYDRDWLLDRETEVLLQAA